MDALKYLVDKYNLDITQPSPIEIPNVGRDSLGYWFKDLGFMYGVELGVEKGIFSKILLDANPEMTLHCVDSWQYYPEYTARLNSPDLPLRFLETQERLAGYPKTRFTKKFSMDAVNDFENESLDFVYVDANHDLPYVMDDLIQWEKKVKHGGIFCGHDYIKARPTKPSKVKVIEALAWYTELKPIKTWFIIGAKAKTPGTIRDNDRSWMWVKE
jgi:hypothetical protein